ncbi:uncharacterized protein KZ484_016973 [Pholidichthys leucotaenia]
MMSGFWFHDVGHFRVSAVSQFSCPSCLPCSYETVASILHTSGSSDAGHLHPSLDPQLELYDEDAEVLCSSEAETDPILDVEISPPTAFSDVADSQTIKENTSKASDETRGMSLVESLRLAAIEKEREREQEMERWEKERTETNILIEKDERENAIIKEKEIIEKEKETERNRSGKVREKMGEEGLECEKLDKQSKEKSKAQAEIKKQGENINDEIQEDTREKIVKDQNIRQENDIYGEIQPLRREVPPGLSSVQNNQKVEINQPNTCPPLREAELDEIAYDEKLQEPKSAPKPAGTAVPNAEASSVTVGPSDPVLETKSKTDKSEDSVISGKKRTDCSSLRSIKKGASSLKHDAIPVWLREEEQEEEVEYEKGQEDLGSVWLAELYMEGESGIGLPFPAVNQKPSSPPVEQMHYQSSASSLPNKPQPPESLTSQPQPNPPSVSYQKETICPTMIDKPPPKHNGQQKQPPKGQKTNAGRKTSHTLEVVVEEGELLQSSVVPWPLPPSTNTSNISCKISKLDSEAKVDTHSDTNLKMRDEKDKTSCLNMDTNSTKSESPHMNNLQKELSKDQQLQEEERFLLTKLHLMSGDASPVTTSRGMKRLIPAPGDIDCEIIEARFQASKGLITPFSDELQEISLTETEEPLIEEDV